MTRRPLAVALLLLLASVLVTLIAPMRSPGGGIADATTTLYNCTGTWYFDSSTAGETFVEGETWQNGTFTDIENDHMMLVRLDNGHEIGRFPQGFLLGDEATIQFAQPIRIVAILWHDNDPNPGETGWSFNGIAAPLTGDGGTIVTPVDLTTSTVNILAGGDSGGVDFCFVPVGGGGEGCTPGYWKNHTEAWAGTGYTTGQLVSSVFTGANALQAGQTLLQALNGGGGPGVNGAEKILLRAAVASLLNTAHSGVDFSMTTAQVISQVSAALATDNRATILALATALDTENNAGCPL